ncbi:hypothetical protein NQ317_005179 [Molorchus minor]|uniref:Tetraspanin n=1 Tax=Molorchus minor TaxID=1323400 RepID=A0ABQ9JDM2_9CUCU|nr:hypothetical protein NQ317_005179 [Molorchus minor]
MRFVPNEHSLRVALLVFSICFGVLSVCLVALGVVYVDELGWPRRYIGLDFLELPTLIIILGAVSLVLAVAGCICAKSYNRPFFIFFGLILCVILCLELTIAVIAFQNSGYTRRVRTEALMELEYSTTDSEYFHTIEEHYQCCGVSGREPKCVEGDKPIIAGCAAVINDALDKVAHRVGIAAMVLSFIQGLEISCVFSISFLMNIY